MSLLLYVRLGCHLCWQVRQDLARYGIAHEAIDIDEDEALRAQYDVLVPVLYHPQSERELIYPFDEEALFSFIQSVNTHE